MATLPIPPKNKFYDLNVPYNENQKHMDSIISMLTELGYSVTAFSVHVPAMKKGDKGKKKIPIAPKLPEVKGVMMLTRVTVELAESQDSLTLRDVTANGGFDIIAAEPKTEKAFFTACTQPNIDIISIDSTDRLPYYFKVNQVRAAIARGAQFEINYSPMIRDSTVRRITTTSALRLNEASKSKNIILSSKAIHPLELRGPFDVANLGLLFGLKENAVPHTVSHNCRCVIVNSFTRKTAKGAVFIQKIDDSNAKQEVEDDFEIKSKKAKLDIPS